MDQPRSAEGVSYDPAAFVAAAIAVATSAIVASGPYTLFSVALGTTLIFVLLAYRHSYTGWKAAAFGACFGLCAILIAGYIIDVFPVGTPPPADKSRVTDWEVFLVWLGCGLIAGGVIQFINTRPKSK